MSNTPPPEKIKLAEKIKLPICNRDGDLMIARDYNGKCYMILEANTFHLDGLFEGIESADYLEITPETFLLLSKTVDQ